MEKKKKLTKKKSIIDKSKNRTQKVFKKKQQKILTFKDTIYGCDVKVYYSWDFNEFRKHWLKITKANQDQREYWNDIKDNGWGYCFGLKNATNLIWISDTVPKNDKLQYLVHEIQHAVLNMVKWRLGDMDLSEAQEPITYYTDAIFGALYKQIITK